MSNCIDSTQHTGADTCRTNASRSSSSAVVTRASTFVTTGNFGSLNVSRSRSGQSVLGRLHQRAMKRRTDIQLDHSRRRLSVTQSRDPPRPCCRQYHLAGRVDIRNRANIPMNIAGGFRANLLNINSSSPPITAAIAPRRQAPLPACSVRGRAPFAVRDKSKTPAATSAEYSPKLCPATNAGASAPSSRARDRQRRKRQNRVACSPLTVILPPGLRNRAAKSQNPTHRQLLQRPVALRLTGTNFSELNLFHHSQLMEPSAPQMTNDNRHRFHHRINTAPHVTPPPNEAINTRSPSFTRPLPHSSESAIGWKPPGCCHAPRCSNRPSTYPHSIGPLPLR